MAKVTLGPLDDVAPGSARRYDVGKLQLAVVRIDDKV